MTSIALKTAILVISMTALTAQAAEPAANSAARKDTPRSLDLKLGPLSRIFTSQQIDAVLSRATDPALENVEVEAPRLTDLPYRDRSASTGETVFKSVVSWLAPSSLYAANANYTPDATAPLRPPMMASAYHASFPPPYSQR